MLKLPSIVVCVFFICTAVQAKLRHELPSDGGKIAFAFSGAGGRLSQHLALMEALVKGLTPSGQKIRPDVLSGASSGSISAVALNFILQYEDMNSSVFTWDDYKSMVFDLTSSQIYDNSVEGIAKIMTYNIFEGYFLDNSPLQTFLGDFLQKIGVSKFGQLYIPTALSVVNQSSGDSYRFWSDDPQWADLDLLELVMASTALPMAFTPRTISALGNTVWIDGGTGIDTLPVYAPLHDANVDELYVLCYGSALTSGGAQLPFPLDDILLLKNGLAVIDDMRVDLFNGGLDMAQKSNIPSYSFIPALNTSFSALDFDHEKEEYVVTMNWATQNNPTLLNPQKEL